MQLNPTTFSIPTLFNQSIEQKQILQQTSDKKESTLESQNSKGDSSCFNTLTSPFVKIKEVISSFFAWVSKLFCCCFNKNRNFEEELKLVQIIAEKLEKNDFSFEEEFEKLNQDDLKVFILTQVIPYDFSTQSGLAKELFLFTADFMKEWVNTHSDELKKLAPDVEKTLRTHSKEFRGAIRNYSLYRFHQLPEEVKSNYKQIDFMFLVKIEEGEKEVHSESSLEKELDILRTLVNKALNNKSFESELEKLDLEELKNWICIEIILSGPLSKETGLFYELSSRNFQFMKEWVNTHSDELEQFSDVIEESFNKKDSETFKDAIDSYKNYLLSELPPEIRKKYEDKK